MNKDLHDDVGDRGQCGFKINKANFKYKSTNY